MKTLRLLLLLLCANWLTMPGAAHAADPVICSASIPGGVDFGSIDPLVPGNTDTASTLSYSCTSSVNTNYYVTVCFNIAAGPLGASAGNRQLGGPGGNQLFQLYRDSGRTQPWGAINDGTFPTPALANFYLAKKATQGGTIPIYGRFFGGQANATPGAYTTNFAYPNVQITGVLNTGPGVGSCGSAGTDAAGFSSFSVNATLIKSCTVTAGAASNIQIGAVSGVPANSGGNSGTNSISVTCSKTTPFFVGLAPSNGNTAGLGVMSGTGGNTDKASYQLRSGSVGGPIWGDTATATTVGNGVAGSGSGSGLALTIPVFAIAPSADFTPDNYTDTVTVKVNY
jgi:spore coat protein U-like protein